MSLKKLLNIQTKNITSAALILGAASFVSALFGLFRDRLLASRFGAGNELDIYYTAFKIPDLVSMVMIMGAISAAIIPTFSEYLTRSQKEAWRFLSNLLNLFLVFLILILIILVIFTPQLINLIAPGFYGEKKELTVFLTRIMFLSPILLGVSNIISSVLQVFQRFLITSLSPILYNIGIILGIIFFVPRIGVSGLAWGVVLGGLLHLLIQLPVFLRLGFKPINIFDYKEAGFIKVIKLTLPRSLGLAASQINLIVVTAIASTLTSGSVAVFNLAESLSRPVFTFAAVAFSTAAFPALSLAFSKKEKEKFNKVFFHAFDKILILVLPLSFLLLIFKNFWVKVILQVGKFGAIDTNLTAACLGMFAIGIFAQGLVLLLAKAFYALHDTKTPAITSVIGMVVNIVLSLLFVKLLSFSNFFEKNLVNLFNLPNAKGMEVIGLPLAISLSAIIQFLIIFFLFRRKRAIVFNGNTQ